MRVIGKDMAEDVERLMQVRQGAGGGGIVVTAYFGFQETKTVHVVEFWSMRDEALSMRCVKREVG